MSESETDIADLDAALAAAGRGIVATTEMKNKLGGLLTEIVGLHASKPWGTSEAGENFEKVYQTDKGGAQFVIDNAPTVVNTADDAMGFAAYAVTHISALDEDIAQTVWKLDPAIGSQIAAGNHERDELDKLGR
ncbi:hypothetical protein [Dactylosporangium sp. CA-092794]|uniref:hypothetical protein n=1 Tax=Dactylosporangium sp. CA-092794 TaxID=3239929 RepID=UPI003D89D28F